MTSEQEHQDEMRQRFKAHSERLRSSVYTLISEERERQLEKFGVQEHPLSTWYLIASEEAGEVAQAILHLADAERKLAYHIECVNRNIKLEKHRGVRLGNSEKEDKAELLRLQNEVDRLKSELKTEIVQNAAVLVAWLEDT